MPSGLKPPTSVILGGSDWGGRATMSMLSLEIGEDVVDGQIYFWEGGSGGAVEVNVQRAESGDLRGLRVGALGDSECGILTSRVWGLRGSTGERNFSNRAQVWGCCNEGDTRQRKSERVPSGVI